MGGSSLCTDVQSPVGKKSPKRLASSPSSIFFCLHFTSLCQSLFIFLLVLQQSHSDRESLAHLLADDFLTVVQALPVVSRQRSPQPQQVPANTTPHRSAAGPASTLNKSHTSLLPCRALSLKVGEGVIHLSVSGAQLCRVHTLRSHGCRR